MGKGDIKTRRGKLFSGSYGKRRQRKKSFKNKPETIQQKPSANIAEPTVKKSPAKTTQPSKAVSAKEVKPNEKELKKAPEKTEANSGTKEKTGSEKKEGSTTKQAK